MFQLRCAAATSRLARALPMRADAAAARSSSAAAAVRLQPCRAAASSGGGDGGDGVAPPDVRELARMAHISVTDQEVADWGRKIEGIVEWFGQLQEVDVEGVPPALRADVEGASTLRPDEVVRRAAGEDLLQQAADREGPFVRVPKIATAADD
ncbi:glutamyl-tRNA(Gln) amidotransferase subunit chloroplastic mitochondrial [Micractinium conductrix]|uniref:Glutamyl-tRNA(Gln) amidotransferase subunit C, chloroplastic/mitochondrial n=1 Tax=Micractinium conductrix TaxID=554055 RepID=A0A2P6VH98_9CHLO|nr:glutamyl-tRNA(Gln) amidotransferase subunit chloroplastic mitochondrial [Micractinium conductrix]|eukprot:PSC73462.1 glutamyl-tRNA(Gln) amidotransferase subunit chloroplastic mitochondrial [Micractinium conductrix]